jgi:hypothetical protein
VGRRSLFAGPRLGCRIWEEPICIFYVGRPGLYCPVDEGPGDEEDRRTGTRDTNLVYVVVSRGDAVCDSRCLETDNKVGCVSQFNYIQRARAIVSVPGSRS